MSDLEQELRRHVEGDVRFDQFSRLLYSTDASMYQMEPMGVVIPRHAGDVQAVVEVANRMGAPILSRGGGTSLTGQTVNHAVVIDFSRYMNRVLEVNTEELWARVQPGLVQDELNQHVRSDGLLFGPDTSTSNRATIGGMLGNNSGGSHSIAYGLTIEHVIEIHAILADGSRAVFGEVTPEAFDAKMRASGLEGQIYREVARIRDTYKADIAARYPRHWRRVCGYNLDQLLREGPLNMARLVVGSEGTLLTVIEAKMRLVRRPKKTAVDVILYRDIQEALESSQAILETGPYAVELTDKMILDLARGNITQAARMGFIQGDPAAILMVEYAGDTDAEMKDRIEALEARRAQEHFGYASHIAYDPGEQQSIWKLRKAWARPPVRGQWRGEAHRLHRGHRRRPEAPARVRPALPRHHGQARVRRRLLRPLLGGVPAHPSRHQPQDQARPRAGRGHGGGDLRPRARVRRGDLERARRRPRAEPLPRAGLRSRGIPGLP
jgi:FAD/FMN-containing dehydrogenase